MIVNNSRFTLFKLKNNDMQVLDKNIKRIKNETITQDRKLDQLNLFSCFIVGMMILIFVFLTAYGFPITNVYKTILIYFVVVCLPLIFIISKSILINPPSDAKIIEFLGYYIGTYLEIGIFFTIPFSCRYVVSLKIHITDTGKIKVNDAGGNLIEIGAIIMWEVYSPAKAYYNVHSYEKYIEVQSKLAIRELASSYLYDSNDGTDSLCNGHKKIANELQSILEVRSNIAGIEIKDARISYLAYAPEIIQAMLKYKQMQLIAPTKKRIVYNAINIVEEIIEHFGKNNKIHLDPKHKAQLINNLLIALISKQHIQPITDLE
ncbi:SPFH domain-containing protein [Wolbachia endosymbiont of Pentidionis agamae]|uniref:SPFH domain-containing protein n=1 Tax=Wolbachia endosymbiont of Pentidionis agamae TaxID=3110435 RepID=UPI002FD562FF